MVKENAAKDGIALSLITIKYENLTVEELDELAQQGILTHSLGPNSALGRFRDDGGVLFPEKATAVFCLGE